MLLNDYWNIMREKGFILNCLFDVVVCGVIIVFDKILGLEEVFGD